ncbi:CoA pyrophosphatase [Nakamurella flavida]|uniref:CoA pyrophosphatase n=1 Tax=Nakamurella flavida TaxID=363630 RepID=A0A939C5J8_9ACTN|nr:CoA pyrophosphatase [Nakamurella flavida]MBM9476267.1 CoA pyrophosphatase [Nakamurella flavida]MDP9779633.1 8-oxo-dGTP pyrophosphatase MutT (NUDIX family) [Nakamurella flavida]
MTVPAGVGDGAGRDGDPTTGRLLVDPTALPGWLRPLAQRVDGAGLPPLPRAMAQRAPADARRGAVLMLLGEGPAGPDLLLTVRADTLRAHPGQPAFPGGGADPGEDAVATALREGAEETGLHPEGVTPVALFPEVYVVPSRYRVRPVLAYWHTPGEVGPVDPAETAQVARVPIADLADPDRRGQVALRDGFVSPAFDVAGTIVWGFTGALVDLLVRAGGWERPWDPDRRLHPPGLVHPPGPVSTAG